MKGTSRFVAVWAQVLFVILSLGVSALMLTLMASAARRLLRWGWKEDA